jgi:molybdenum cofactor synthesis domain-containing protein
MPLIPLRDAVEHVLGRVRRLDEVDVALLEAPGLVAAESVTAPEPVPPFDNTAVDGFAVRAADTVGAPVELDVVGTIAAGAAGAPAIPGGGAARIMTGAPMPPGADAVVMVEDSEPAGPDRVRLLATVTAGQHVRPAGDDLPAGAVAVAGGTVLGPAHVGLLATVGRTRVRVVRRPRVGVISTGDELVDDGSPLARGQIRDSNRVMLLALCRRAGVEGVDLGLVRDDEDAIEAALRAAAGSCDAVVSSGGVSMGDYDYVKAVLDRIGDMAWMQIAIKPAKPFAFGTIGTGPGGGGREVPVFGLPGNPVSSLVSFELLARPGLRAMAGWAEPRARRVPGVAGTDLRRRVDGKVHFVRVGLSVRDGALVAVPTGGQGSHQLAASAGAEALAEVPDGEGIAAGSPVDLLLLD